jgi:hypothetical protein
MEEVRAGGEGDTHKEILLTIVDPSPEHIAAGNNISALSPLS